VASRRFPFVPLKFVFLFCDFLLFPPAESFFFHTSRQAGCLSPLFQVLISNVPPFFLFCPCYKQLFFGVDTFFPFHSPSPPPPFQFTFPTSLQVWHDSRLVFLRFFSWIPPFLIRRRASKFLLENPPFPCMYPNACCDLCSFGFFVAFWILFTVSNDAASGFVFLSLYVFKVEFLSDPFSNHLFFFESLRPASRVQNVLLGQGSQSHSFSSLCLTEIDTACLPAFSSPVLPGFSLFFHTLPPVTVFCISLC